MNDQQSVTTIERGYANDLSQDEEAHPTTLPRTLFLVGGQIMAKDQPAPASEVSPASLLRAYQEQVVTNTGSVVGSGGWATIRGEFILPHEPQSRGPWRPHVLSRRERHAAVIALLEKWVADDMGDNEDAWIRVKKRIEESRTSARKRFSD